MRSSRIQSDSGSISLFPFLAVLLCTMGSLIVILVVLAHQARVQAAAKQDAATKPLDEELQIARENLTWQVEQLADSQAQTAQGLQRQRLALAHLEDHLRRLRDEMQRLAVAAHQMAEMDGASGEQREHARAQLDQLNRRIQQTERLVAEERAKAAHAQRSYAIIPYQGPNKTTRRPIFIECRSDAVVIQPEGVTLRPEDFQEPLGPQNPLASAVRAASEFLASQDGGTSEPYPLLLVRPSGVVAYYKARAALESWGADFGYELIGDQWNLEFPPVDSRLAEVESRAVREGRIYQRQLAVMAPSKYGRGRPTYRAAPHRGGFIREGGPGTSSRDSGQGSAKQGEASNPQQGQQQGASQNTGSETDGDADQLAGATQPPLGKGGQVGGNMENPLATSVEAGPGGNVAGSEKFNARGNNWALRDAVRGAVPISRPVRVLVRADRLVLLFDQPGGGGRVVMLGERTADSIDEFVAALHEHTKSWGIAGNGLYWRPVLILQIGPEASQRAADMKVLLRRSGVEFRDDQQLQP